MNGLHLPSLQPHTPNLPPPQSSMYTGVAHPFGHWDAILDKAKEYVRDTIAVLREAHGAPK